MFKGRHRKLPCGQKVLSWYTASTRFARASFGQKVLVKGFGEPAQLSCVEALQNTCTHVAGRDQLLEHFGGSASWQPCKHCFQGAEIKIPGVPRTLCSSRMPTSAVSLERSLQCRHLPSASKTCEILPQVRSSSFHRTECPKLQGPLQGQLAAGPIDALGISVLLMHMQEASRAGSVVH